jgi:hypothetical protein
MILPEGAEYSLTESALHPFQAEPTHSHCALAREGCSVNPGNDPVPRQNVIRR